MRVIDYLHWWDRDVERGILAAMERLPGANTVLVAREDAGTVNGRVRGMGVMVMVMASREPGNITVMEVKR